MITQVSSTISKLKTAMDKLPAEMSDNDKLTVIKTALKESF